MTMAFKAISNSFQLQSNQTENLILYTQCIYAIAEIVDETLYVPQLKT